MANAASWSILDIDPSSSLAVVVPASCTSLCPLETLFAPGLLQGVAFLPAKQPWEAPYETL